MSRKTNIGVYVDATNLMRNGGYGMRYDVLREFACRDGGEAIRLNVYASYDADRAQEDPTYRRKQMRFFSSLRDFGFKVIEKKIKWFNDELGNRVGKANADLEMAVEALLQSKNLDRVVIATGDGDFVQVVKALQNRGCRVEVVAFDNVSRDLRREADLFVSGYLVPNLIAPFTRDRGMKEWGEAGSRVRGLCYNHMEEGYGFFRYMTRIGKGIWITDTRDDASPYESVFFHDSQLPPEVNPLDLPSRYHVFEFDLVPSERRPGEAFQAENINIVGLLR
ncbi:MAG: NYN domain-containing protein [Acidobacteriota bacterium]